MESGAFCYRLAPTSRAGGFSGSGNTLGEDDGDGNDDDEDGNDDRDAVGISLFLAFGDDAFGDHDVELVWGWGYPGNLKDYDDDFQM